MSLCVWESDDDDMAIRGESFFKPRDEEITLRVQYYGDYSKVPLSKHAMVTLIEDIYRDRTL